MRTEHVTMTCDRCGLEDEHASSDNWGMVYRLDFLDPQRQKTIEMLNRDLCPDCARAFGRWWTDGKPQSLKTITG